MARYSSRSHRYSRFSDYPEYVSVDERRARNVKAAGKLKEQNAELHPIHIEGTKIAKTFWGKAWCDNIQSYQDYSNRLPRGRSYVRTGAVLDLQIETGKIKALVAGSGRKPYSITIDVKPLAKDKWRTIKSLCLGKISSLLAIAQGQLSDEILKAFCNPTTGLFPAPSEIKMNCSCPDWSDLCKHLAAVLYGVGARLDTNPMLFFKLRHIDEKELIGGDIVDTLTQGVEAQVADEDLSNIFGVEFDTVSMVADPAVEEVVPAPKKAKAKTKSVSKVKSTPKAKARVSTKSTPVKISPTVKAKSAPKAKATSKPQVKATPKPWTADRVRVLREKTGLTQEKFAKAIGTYGVKISAWERGRSPIRSWSHEKLEALESQYSINT